MDDFIDEIPWVTGLPPFGSNGFSIEAIIGVLNCLPISAADLRSVSRILRMLNPKGLHLDEHFSFEEDDQEYMRDAHQRGLLRYSVPGQGLDLAIVKTEGGKGLLGGHRAVWYGYLGQVNEGGGALFLEPFYAHSNLREVFERLLLLQDRDL